MKQLIAYCGLICNECPAYIATQANDRAELERVAAMWREEFNEPSITAESILCDGCTVAGRKSGYCGQCQIRPCAMARKVANCAHCDDYGCERLEGLLAFAPEARALLEGIRAGLVA